MSSAEKLFTVEYVLPPSPNFLLTREVTSELADEMQAWLGYWAIEKPEQTLTIFIDSPGGQLASGLRIADSLTISPNTIRTVATGLCFSGAALICAAGDKGERYAYPHADFMIHKAKLVLTEEELKDIKNKPMIAHSKKANEVYLQFLATLTGQTVEKIRKDTTTDYYLTPEEALAYGVVDHIVETKSRK